MILVGHCLDPDAYSVDSEDTDTRGPAFVDRDWQEGRRWKFKQIRNQGKAKR